MANGENQQAGPGRLEPVGKIVQEVLQAPLDLEHRVDDREKFRRHDAATGARSCPRSPLIEYLRQVVLPVSKKSEKIKRSS